MAIAGWVLEQKRIYFGNASSVRDFRAQLRGTKAALFWAAYLGVLIVFAMIAYSGVVASGSQSIANVQQQLKGFYSTIMGMLELVVALVAPVIVGMSIQAEAQRKSLDLVTTAPVTPKYFLIGKIISGYRYVVMLLFLSLPVSAAAIVLGGATWIEVLVTYFLVALHGLMYIAFSLPIAVMGAKVVPVVFYSYLVCGTWALGFSAMVLNVVMRSTFGGGGATEVPFIYLLTPAGATTAPLSTSVLIGTEVPNWIPATVAGLLVVRFFVLAAGSAMTRFGSKETASLRANGLLYGAALGFFLLSSFPPTTSRQFANVMLLATSPILFVAPFLACWSRLEERKNRAQGVFDVKKILTAAPEGGLPYLVALLAVTLAGGIVAGSINGFSLDSDAVFYLFWIAGSWIAYWSMGWFVSSYNSTGIGMARRAHFALSFLSVLIPMPVLIYLDQILQTELIYYYPPAAIALEAKNMENLPWLALSMFCIAAMFAFIGEKRRRSGVLSMEAKSGRTTH